MSSRSKRGTWKRICCDARFQRRQVAGIRSHQDTLQPSSGRQAHLEQIQSPVTSMLQPMGRPLQTATFVMHSFFWRSSNPQSVLEKAPKEVAEPQPMETVDELTGMQRVETSPRCCSSNVHTWFTKQAVLRIGKGQSAAPVFCHHRSVIVAWAEAVWDVTQSSTRCRRRFEVRRRGGKLKRPWEAAMYPGATFFLTLARLGWSANSARHLVIYNGRWTCWRLRRRQLRGGWKRHCFFGQTHLLVTRPLFSTGSLPKRRCWAGHARRLDPIKAREEAGIAPFAPRGGTDQGQDQDEDHSGAASHSNSVQGGFAARNYSVLKRQ